MKRSPRTLGTWSGSRWAAILTLLLAAPIFAEYSSGYLDSTGNLAAMAGELVIFVPLYGLVALLLREVAVRCGLGWSGLVLLAAGYGLVMASAVDRSVFTLTGTAEPYWADIVGPTWVDPVGLALGPAVGWGLGHALTTVAAAVAATELVVPASSGRRLLGIPGIVVCLVGWLLAVVAVHTWVAQRYRPEPALWQYGLVAVVAAGLIVLAFTRLGRPVRRRRAAESGRRWMGLVLPAALGAALMVAADSAFLSWVATGVCLVLAVGAFVVLRRLEAGPAWHPLSPVAAALGALLARALQAFQTPAAEGVSPAAQLTHVVVVLVVVLALCTLTVARWWRQARRRPLAGLVVPRCRNEVPWCDGNQHQE